ncbi:MAG: ATP-binding cassette domain-containing protein, partial [Monoglobaceae bacterium]
MIKFNNVTKIYDKDNKKALNNVSFDILKGDFVFLIGSTGAGKTTVTRLI